MFVAEVEHREDVLVDSPAGHQYYCKVISIGDDDLGWYFISKLLVEWSNIKVLEAVNWSNNSNPSFFFLIVDIFDDQT